MVIEEEGFFRAKSTNHYDLIGIEAAKTVQNLMGTKKQNGDVKGVYSTNANTSDLIQEQKWAQTKDVTNQRRGTDLSKVRREKRCDLVRR